MTDYPYDMDLVVDPLNPANVVAGGKVYIYDPSDTAGATLLALKDPSGLPLPNPLTSNAHGYIPPRSAAIPQVMWKSGGFTGYFNSYRGLRDEAVLARSAAQQAASEAQLASAGAADAATAQLEAAKSAATTAATDATEARAAALAAQASAEAAAAASAGGGIAIKPSDSDVLIISTKGDGTVVLKPTDSDVLTITT